ncbi:MAG: formyltransferase family protein [Wenzhouxiangellaceae bacterium]
MKLGFVTCVQLGLSGIEAIYEAGYELETIFTLHDDLATGKSGRVSVDPFARQHGIPVHKVGHVDQTSALEKYAELDWLFIVGWSQIAGPEVIRAPRRGVLGIHPTLLPVGRGRAAIPWAILKNLDKTGVTLFKLDDGVDAGPIVAQKEIPLDDRTTATELYREVNRAHVDLIKGVLPGLAADTVRFIEQDETRATVWPQRRPDDGRIDMSGSVVEAERLVRAVTHPYPGAWYYDASGRRIVVWSARIFREPPASDYLEFRDGYLAILESEVVPES